MAEPHPAPRADRAAPAPDPVADARALLAMATGLGVRLRATQHHGSLAERKAAIYVSSLVRQVARLLHGMQTHGVPILRANEGNPGRRVTHYVIRSDRLDGPPAATRLLVVSSDGRLRCCLIAIEGGARLWVDYDSTTAPDDLSQRVVLQALSVLLQQLEQTVTDLEVRQRTHAEELEADIARSKDRMAVLLSQSSAAAGTHASAPAEEPVRPRAHEVGPAARPLALPPAASAQPERDAPVGVAAVGDAAPGTESPVGDAAPDAEWPVGDDLVFALPAAARDEGPPVPPPTATADVPPSGVRPADVHPLAAPPVVAATSDPAPPPLTPPVTSPATPPSTEPATSAAAAPVKDPSGEDARPTRRRQVLTRLRGAI